MMPFRRRRNIRSFMKLSVGLVVVVFFITLTQFLRQIDNSVVNHRGNRHKYEGENPVTNAAYFERKNYLKERVESDVEWNRNRGVESNPGVDDEDSRTAYRRAMNSLERIVHIDLKGSPPKIAYLREFFPYVKSLGATGVIVEYEDFFPYQGDLETVRNQNHYTSTELKKIFELIRENKLTLIPLIQTYGHLEFVLKLKQFAHLREASQHYQVVSPCLNETYDKLLYKMIDQIIDVHPDDLEYIHIGADEVYHVNVNPACKSLQNLKTVQDFFIYHVSRLVDYIKSKRSHLKVMIWDDMIRRNMITKVDANLQAFAKKIIPVVWNYKETVEITDNVFKTYDDLFSEIWTASAFKGATKQLELIPNAKLHFNNHLSWLNVIKNFQSPHKIKGMVLTGWSRYDHMQSVCEVLPAAMPSLALCLQVLVNYEQSDLTIYSRAKELTKCNYNRTSSGFIVDPASVLTYKLSYKLEDLQKLYECDFPGSRVYKWLLELKLVSQYFDSRHERYSHILNKYNLKYKFMNSMILERAKTFYPSYRLKFTQLLASGETEFDKYFYADLYEELTNVYILNYVELIDEKVIQLNKTILPDYAPVRPFNKIDHPIQFV